jgi:hypothetical protein
MSSWFSNLDLARLADLRQPFIVPRANGGRFAVLERYSVPAPPMEQTDIMEDISRSIDVHRRSRFDVVQTVQPTIEVRRQDDIFVQGLAVTTPAVAAQFNGAQLQNDQNNYVLRLIAAWADTGVGGPVAALTWRSNSNVLLATTSGLNRYDTRRANVGLGVVRTGSEAAQSGFVLAFGIVQVGLPFFLPADVCKQLVLGPQGNLTCYCNTVAQALNVTFVCQVEPIRRTRDKLLGF